MFVGGFEKFAYQLFDRFPMHTIREKDKTKNASCNYRKKITSSGLCMRPRVHATFKLFTLGFVVTLLEMKKEKRKRKTVRLIVLGEKNNYASDIWTFHSKYLRNIVECEQLELEIWTGYYCGFLHHTSMKREIISICVEAAS